MKKLILAGAALAFSISAAAQSAQERLDERYNLALAAGYKALFMCGAIANAERNGTTRTPESVHEWELTGVYDAIDGIVRELDYRIVRSEEGSVARVEVLWAEDMPARYANATWTGGCRLAPIGMVPAPQEWEPYLTTRDDPEPKAEPELFPVGEPVEIGAAPESTKLQTAVADALSEKYGDGTRTTAVLVRLNSRGNGLTQVASYKKGFDERTPQRTWSVAKSIAATLIGAAVHQGQVDVNHRTGREEWRDDARRAITIDHLLRMASGRYSDTPGNRTDPLYAGGSTVEETATNWPLIHEPGTKYRYANNDTLMAVKAITDTDKSVEPADFFAAAGMVHTVAETDWVGDYILSSQVWATAPDLAALGQLYLNDGVAPDGMRLLPENWLEYVSAPSGPQPEGSNFGYGAGWWLFNDVEGVPADTIAALGNRGQYLVIVPSRDVVIVRRGEDMVGTRFDIAAFTRDVLAALEE
ncbi:MAG: serine hydrolase [Erythrobacter sp.]|nr:serine hydrolase [Erythrobacter sp.]